MTTDTCAVFFFDTCLRYKSFVQVVHRFETSEDVWRHLTNVWATYALTRSPIRLQDQPAFFRDFVDTLSFLPRRHLDVSCDRVLIVYADW